MKMSRHFIAVAICAFALISCTHTSPETRAAGEPILGYSNFSDPTLGVQGGGGIGGSMGGM